MSDAAAPPAGPAPPHSSSNTSGRLWQGWMNSLPTFVQILAWKSGCLLLPERAETGTAQGTGNGTAEKHLGFRDGSLWQLARLEANPCPLKSSFLQCLLTPQTLHQYKPNWCMCVMLSFTMLLPTVEITAQQPSPSQNNP